MDKHIQILDCTLRDGGLGLEDAEKNGISHKCFDAAIIARIIDHQKCSNLDIIELGSIELSAEDKRRFAIYQDVQSVSKTIPADRRGGQMYAALYRGPDTPIEDIPDWNPLYCQVLRVIIRYSELQKSLDFCKALARKGYRVAVQPMLTLRYSEEELQQVIDAANDMGAYALYFVDSYGYMQAQDVVRLFELYNRELYPSIRIGFHAHNNMNLAFSNALAFLAQSSNREIILDACAQGLGQGAGNLQTEIIAKYLNTEYKTTYQYSEILEICEIIERYREQNLWGYSVTTLLPALHKVAYKYAIVLRNQYGLSFSEIDRILSRMPESLRHRYTAENTVELLKRCGYDAPETRRK